MNFLNIISVGFKEIWANTLSPNRRFPSGDRKAVASPPSSRSDWTDTNVTGGISGHEYDFRTRKEGMAHPGATQVGLGRKLLEK